jgi:hypothetical protein
MLLPRVNDLRLLTKPALADLVFPDELSVCYTFMCRPALKQVRLVETPFALG